MQICTEKMKELKILANDEINGKKIRGKRKEKRKERQIELKIKKNKTEY